MADAYDGFSNDQKAAFQFGDAVSKTGTDIVNSARDQAAANSNRQTPIPSYKRGGTVRKTGLARLHKGEEVIPRGKVKKVRKFLKGRKGSR